MSQLSLLMGPYWLHSDGVDHRVCAWGQGQHHDQDELLLHVDLMLLALG